MWTWTRLMIGSPSCKQTCQWLIPGAWMYCPFQQKHSRCRFLPFYSLRGNYHCQRWNTNRNNGGDITNQNEDHPWEIWSPDPCQNDDWNPKHEMFPSQHSLVVGIVPCQFHSGNTGGSGQTHGEILYYIFLRCHIPIICYAKVDKPTCIVYRYTYACTSINTRTYIVYKYNMYTWKINK